MIFEYIVILSVVRRGGRSRRICFLLTQVLLIYGKACDNQGQILRLRPDDYIGTSLRMTKNKRASPILFSRSVNRMFMLRVRINQ